MAMIGVPTRTVSPTSTGIAGHLALVGEGQLDDRLRGLDLDDDLVDRDDVADLHVPGDDLGLGQALADVGQLWLGHVRIGSSWA